MGAEGRGESLGHGPTLEHGIGCRVRPVASAFVRGRLVLVMLAALLLSSCRLQLDANITVSGAGSGEVEVVVGLDADALTRIGGDLRAELRVADLAAAGWRISGPTPHADGYTRVRFRHPFATAEEAATILDSVAGGHGPFQRFRLRRHSSFGATAWEFTGRLDFSGGVQAFGDAALATELDGQPLGRTQAQIEAQLGEPLARAIQVQVAVRLPGTGGSNAPARADGAAVWTVGFGARSVDLEASSRDQRTATLVAVAVSGTCGALLVGYGLVRLFRLGRRRRAT